jgi:hypothetical protein
MPVDIKYAKLESIAPHVTTLQDVLMILCGDKNFDGPEELMDGFLAILGERRFTSTAENDSAELMALFGTNQEPSMQEVAGPNEYETLLPYDVSGDNKQYFSCGGIPLAVIHIIALYRAVPLNDNNQFIGTKEEYERKKIKLTSKEVSDILKQLQPDIPELVDNESGDEFLAALIRSRKDLCTMKAAKATNDKIVKSFQDAILQKAKILEKAKTGAGAKKQPASNHSRSRSN